MNNTYNLIFLTVFYLIHLIVARNIKVIYKRLKNYYLSLFLIYSTYIIPTLIFRTMQISIYSGLNYYGLFILLIIIMSLPGVKSYIKFCKNSKMKKSTTKQKFTRINVILIASVFEELFFRGYIQYTLFAQFGLVSVPITSLLFILSHYVSPTSKYFNIKVYLLQFTLSIILGGFYICTENILLCILGHLIFNLSELGKILKS
ncbi:CPBP family intramembrane metalloprotease [Clostridium sp. D2Q-14]|uniref:CPBP family intramembrane glutamic endopeptidase n=1 Tax=Anaeromonas gelatinilytica TaxID=2683194 RepID=UPI00193BCC14|nr:CPBP family intramembrane glutamic endopeptidase [Anaeromonas gelatinilytica]MBS4535042.1 CPBP family intramembrane metalloprotease [Anaeromonas gelatinilytica]